MTYYIDEQYNGKFRWELYDERGIWADGATNIDSLGLAQTAVNRNKIQRVTQIYREPIKVNDGDS